MFERRAGRLLVVLDIFSLRFLPGEYLTDT